MSSNNSNNQIKLNKAATQVNTTPFGNEYNSNNESYYANNDYGYNSNSERGKPVYPQSIDNDGTQEEESKEESETDEEESNEEPEAQFTPLRFNENSEEDSPTNEEDNTTNEEDNTTNEEDSTTNEEDSTTNEEKDEPKKQNNKVPPLSLSNPPTPLKKSNIYLSAPTIAYFHRNLLFPVSEYFTYDSFLRYLERYVNSDKYKSENKYLSTNQINIDTLVGTYDKRKNNKNSKNKDIKKGKTKGSMFGSLKRFLPKRKDKQSKKSHSKLNNYIAENYVYIKNIYRNYNKKTIKGIKKIIKGVKINTNVSKIFKFSETINELFASFINDYPCDKEVCYNDEVEVIAPNTVYESNFEENTGSNNNTVYESNVNNAESDDTESVDTASDFEEAADESNNNNVESLDTASDFEEEKKENNEEKQHDNEINEIKREIGGTINNIINKIQQNRNAILNN